MPVTKSAIWLSLAASTCLSAVAWCQSPAATSPSDLDEENSRMRELVLRVTRSNYDPTVGRQEMPFLQEAFKQARDPLMKENLASVIVTLGKRDDAYWAVLAQGGQEALDSQVPDPLVYDASGKSASGETSPQFSGWAKKKGLTLRQAYDEEFRLSSGILLIARTGDARGLPILRTALSSPNHMIQSFAAKGLAVLQDKDSIPRIIEAAKQAPREAQWVIAEPLMAFNDPQAQAAARELIPEKFLDGVIEKLRNRGPRGVL